MFFLNVTIYIKREVKMLENLAGPVFALFSAVISIIIWTIIINAILSWLIMFDVVNTRNKIVGTIVDVTERISAPVLAPIRRIIPPIGGMDLSPIVLILGLQFIRNLVASFLF